MNEWKASENDPNLPEEQKENEYSFALHFHGSSCSDREEESKEQKHSQGKIGQEKQKQASCHVTLLLHSKSSALEQKSYNKHGRTTTGRSESFHLDLRFVY